MAKNKGKLGKSKEVVEEPDEFVSGMDKLVRAIAPYRVHLIVGLSLVVIVSVVLVGYGWWNARKESHATVVYSEALATSRLAIEPEPLDTEIQADARPTFKSLDEKANATLPALERLESEHGSTTVAARARIFHASVLLDAGRYDEAAELYRNYDSSDASPELRVLAREGLGYSLEGKALANEDTAARGPGLEQALAAFQNMQTKDGAVGRPYALYHEGRLLETLGRKPEAQEAFKKVLDQDPPRRLKEQVDIRLAMLQGAAE